MKISEDLNKITTSQRNLAKALSLTQPRISQLIKDGTVIRDESDTSGGVYILQSLKNFYQNRQKGTDEVDINIERALHERAKRLLAELQLERARGNVYDSKIVERVITGDLVKLRTRLLTLPSKLAPMIEGKSKGEIDLILTREIEDTLAEMSNFDPSVFISEDIDDEESESV